MFDSSDMCAHTDRGKKTVLLFVFLQILPSLSLTVNIRPHVRKIIAKDKIRLAPVHIGCFVNDVVRISAPIIQENDLYYLSKPNGDEMKLDLHVPKELNINRTRFYHDRLISITFPNRMTSIVKQEDSVTAFKANDFDKKSVDLEPNEFLVGPLLEEDNGSWVLTVFTKSLDGDWIELFQEYTMAITEYIKLKPRRPHLQVGDTFNLSFAYPFTNMEMCEIVAPRTTYDRFYNRTLDEMNKCGFSVPNITKNDEGIWKIIGYGKIIYQGEVYLNVYDNSSGTTMAPQNDSAITEIEEENFKELVSDNN